MSRRAPVRPMAESSRSRSPPGGAAGDRDAGRAKGRGLSPVHVGDDERAGAGPEERALGEEADRLAGELEGRSVIGAPDPVAR